MGGTDANESASGAASSKRRKVDMDGSKIVDLDTIKKDSVQL